MTMVSPGRHFQLWEYKVSHGLLLLRSPRDSVHATNIDVIFADVRYMDLPRFLGEIETDSPTERDVLFACERLGKMVGTDDVFVIKSNNKRYVIVASGFKICENNMDVFETDFDHIFSSV